MTTIAVAQQIATLAHRGQTDMANKPYIDHCERVVQNCIAYCDDTKFGDHPELWPDGVTIGDVIKVAYLHDVVEDTNWNLDHLKELGGFSPEVLAGIEAMTQRWVGEIQGIYTFTRNETFGKAQGYQREDLETYWTRVKNNPIALIVKVHGDIPDNNDPARKSYLPQEQQDKLSNKYARALAFLQETP